MSSLPLIIALVQVAAAVLFGLGIRATGTGRRQPTRHGLWIGPVLFLAAPAAAARLTHLPPSEVVSAITFLAAPSAAARLTQLSAMDAVFPITFLIGFAVAVTATARRRSTHPAHPTTGDDPS